MSEPSCPRTSVSRAWLGTYEITSQQQLSTRGLGFSKRVRSPGGQ